MDQLGHQPDAAVNPATPELSIVIPFFDEAPNVAPLLAELRETVDALGVPAEVLLIDDGSTDETASELKAAAATWPSVRVHCFTKNSGQAAALWWGFNSAQGQWISMLDGDGQNPPAELARLWSLRTTADMIVGVRAARRDSTLRRTMSRVANAVRRRLLRDGLSDSGCSLKLFRREIVGSFLPIRTMYSFLGAFAVAAGWTVRETPVSHRPRNAGKSKYGLRAMAVHPLLDLLALCWLLRRALRQTQLSISRKVPPLSTLPPASSRPRSAVATIGAPPDKTS